MTNEEYKALVRDCPIVAELADGKEVFWINDKKKNTIALLIMILAGPVCQSPPIIMATIAYMINEPIHKSEGHRELE